MGALERVLENILGRLHGPMKFRLLLQPLTATALAARAGLRDAREGRVPYFRAVCTDAERRRLLVREGWKDIARVFAAAVVVDGLYQVLELRWFYPGEALLVAALLALLPYLVIRGPVSRLARLFGGRRERRMR
jgi:hypothetical protein